MAAPSVPNWQAQVLTGVGAPVTPANLLFVNDWAKAEGGGATNNPFNTTEPGFNSTGKYNSVGVQNYGDPQAGINATVATLKNGHYGNILNALHQGTDAKASAAALAASPWGTGSLVLKMLGGQPVTNTGHGAVTTTQLAKSAVAGPQGASGDSRTALLGMLQSSLSNYANTGQAGADPAKIAALTAQVQTQPLTLPKVKGAAGTAADAAKTGSVVSLAKQYIGTPYVWGGESPTGFDCSGLLQYVWGKNGVNIPRTTYAQFTSGSPIAKGQLQAGDAVFFKGSDSKNVNGQILPGHVGLYIGNGKFIEAPHTGAKVQISNLAGRTDYMGARSYS